MDKYEIKQERWKLIENIDHLKQKYYYDNDFFESSGTLKLNEKYSEGNVGVTKWTNRLRLSARLI